MRRTAPGWWWVAGVAALIIVGTACGTWQEIHH